MKPRIIEKCYKFDFPIERVFLFYSNCSLISFLSNSLFKLSNLSRYPTLEGENFEGVLEPCGSFKGKFIRSKNSCSYKKMTMELYFSKMRCVISKTFLKISEKDSTVLYNKIKLFIEPEVLSDKTLDLDLIIKDIRITACSLVKEAVKALSTSSLFLYQVESCLLDAPLEEVLSIIKDLDKFKSVSKLVNTQLDSLAFIDDDRENIIKLVYDKGFAIMKYEGININNLGCNTKNCSIILDFLWGIPKIPLQKISYNLSKITNTKTHFLFKHEFKEPICRGFIKICAENKKIMLKDLQNYFLKKNESKK